MNSISDSELKVLIKNNYLKFLKRIASDEEIEYHFNQIKNKTISLDELDSIFQNSQEYKDLVRHNNKIQNISKDFEEIILNIKEDQIKEKDIYFRYVPRKIDKTKKIFKKNKRRDSPFSILNNVNYN